MYNPGNLVSHSQRIEAGILILFLKKEKVDFFLFPKVAVINLWG